MPTVEEVYFYLLLARRMRIFMKDSFWGGTAVKEMHCLLNCSRVSGVGFVSV